MVLEKSEDMGGLSRTVKYKGNRMDIGGHRFFSKSDRVMKWWLEMMPLEAGARAPPSSITAWRPRVVAATRPADPGRADRVMLLRDRKSRIYFLRRFFDYPIWLNMDTLIKLGLLRTLRIGISYLNSALFPVKPETTLENF